MNRDELNEWIRHRLPSDEPGSEVTSFVPSYFSGSLLLFLRQLEGKLPVQFCELLLSGRKQDFCKQLMSLR